MDASLALKWLIVIPLIGSIFIYLIGRLAARRYGDSYGQNPACWVALLTLVASLGALGFAAVPALNGMPVTWQVGAVSLTLDGIGVLLAAVVLILGFMVTLYSVRYMQWEVGEEKFYALLVAMTGTIVGLGCARDLFNLWVWFEAMAITSYMLVAFYRLQPASLEAGVKYLVQSASGSVLVLLGVALVFAQSGTLDLAAIRAGEGSGVPAIYLAAGPL